MWWKRPASAVLAVVVGLAAVRAGFSGELSVPARDIDVLVARLEAAEREIQQLQALQPAPVAAAYQTSASGFVAPEERATGGFNSDGGAAGNPGLDFYVDYDKGFVLRAYDKAKDPFELKINGRLQTRVIGFSDTGDSPSGNEFNFEFERARLLFTGHVRDPRFTYFIQIDGDGADRTFLNFKDYYLQYEFSEALALLVGKWKAPFGRQETLSAFRQQFVDRTVANEFFNIDRGLGVGLQGSLDDRLFYGTAIINGFDVEDSRGNRRGDLDSNPAFAARVYLEPWGPFGANESDLEFHQQSAIRIGGSLAYSEIDAAGANELRPPTLRIVDTGEPIADAIPGAADGFNVLVYAADIGFKCRGWSVYSEYFLRDVFNFESAAVDHVRAHGFYVQTGYFLVPAKLEIASRWSRVWGDRFPGHPLASADEIAAAVNYFLSGQNLKLSFDVTRLNGAPLFSEDATFQPGDDGLLYRGQLQWQF